MPEAATATQPQFCEFCNMRSTLLCDGKLPSGKTCDKRICRRCAAEPKGNIHLNMGRKGCRWDTRDLCPECRAAGRSI